MMIDAFAYRGGTLLCEQTSVANVARQVGTPCYLYSQRAIENHFRCIADAFAPVDPLICYAVKANGNLTILRLLHGLGAGFDIASGGELFLVQRAGGEPAKVVFAGVGKTEAEVCQALTAGILMFNVESASGLALIDRVAGDLATQARVAIRLNPDVDPKTHRYIATGKKETKFGIDLETARGLVAHIGDFPNVRLIGYHAHVGSQVTDLEPHAASLRKVIDFASACSPSNSTIDYINIGGGFGIDYRPGQAPPPAAFAECLIPLIRQGGKKLIMEPGRFITGNAGILLTRVVHVKKTHGRRFLVCDAAMNDLIRPALYGAYHQVWPVDSDAPFETDGLSPADVVGPVCETADFLAQERPLPEVAQGDLLAVFSAGAYGFAMSSNYNARMRPCEVLVHGDNYRVVRRRETYEDLIRQEIL